jgi:phytoene synthase
LAQLGEGWEYLAGSEPLDAAELNAYARLRGGLLFACTARLLARATDALSERGGEAWALADLARRTSRPEERRAALSAVLARDLSGSRWPARLRPLGMLALLAERDARRGAEHLESAGAPARMLRMLRHRLTGR